MIGDPGRQRRGVVAAFDEAVGLGTLAPETADSSTEAGGGRSWPFHCTAIADGTRTIEVGMRVAFRLRAAHHGTWEAADIVSIRD